MNNALIRPPANPFWDVLKTFGRDELTGGVVALFATLCLEGTFYLYNGSHLFSPTQLICLALAGPILEKVGFFFWHFKEACEIYSTTPEVDRKVPAFYIKKAFKGGAKTLFWDICLHDPLYVGLMLVGMRVHPQTPAWLLVPIAFGLAVIAVAFLEVAINEIRYLLYKRRKYQEGYELESYIDVRFYLDKSIHADDVMRDLQDRFLPEHELIKRKYEDTYFKVGLPSFNGREGKLRLRSREVDEDSNITTIQHIYSSTVEGGKTASNQYKFFLRKKDKLYKVFENPDLALIASKNEAAIFDDSDSELEHQLVKFTRYAVYDRNVMLVAVDVINGETDQPFIVVELKVYPGKEALLIEAMRYVMHRYPAMQTTHHKIDLLEY